MTNTRNKVCGHLTNDYLSNICSFPAGELYPGQHEERNGRDSTECSAESDRRDDRNRNEPAKPNSRADTETNGRGGPGE